MDEIWKDIVGYAVEAIDELLMVINGNMPFDIAQ